MAEYPALPLWTDAWVSDTHHLSRLERGTYHDLLVLMWRTPLCRVPNDDGWLAKHLRMTNSEVSNELRPLIKELCQCDGNWLTQKRLTREYEYVSKTRLSQSERAKSRWKKKNRNAQLDAHSGNAPTPYPHPHPKQEDTSLRSVARKIATRWDSEASVPEDWRQNAGMKRAEHGLPQIDVNLEADKFCLYWASKSGQNGTKIDWQKTWINWALKAENPRKSNGDHRPTAHDNFAVGAYLAAVGRAGKAD